MALSWRRVAPGVYETKIGDETIELRREPYHRAMWSLMGSSSTMTFSTKVDAQDWLTRRLALGLAF